MVIESREAVLISNILYKIYSVEDEVEMRKTCLDLIPNLVMCSKATFYLGAEDDKYFMDRPVGYQMSEELLNLYLDYDKFDYMNTVFINSETEVYRETDYFVDDVRMNSPYFKELLVPNDMYYSVQTSLYHSKIFLGVVTLFRGKNDPDFSDHDLFLLRLIKDHLALRLYQDYNKNNDSNPVPGMQKFMIHYDLTTREADVLQLMFKGLSNDEMADQLHISHFTIQKHISNIYKKLKINSKGQLFKLYSES